MKTLALHALAVLSLVLPTASVYGDTAADKAFTKQVSDILAECKKITVGMTRADLLRVFTTEGGKSTAARRTFVYRGCPLIKVDVEFQIADRNKGLEEHPTDPIIKISAPYLAYEVWD